RFPGLPLGKLGERMVVVAAFTPIDEAHTSVLIRYYVPIQVVGRLLAWLAAIMEARFVLQDDERILASSSPRQSDLRSNKLVRADAGIGLWHKLYHRSIAAF